MSGKKFFYLKFKPERLLERLRNQNIIREISVQVWFLSRVPSETRSSKRVGKGNTKWGRTTVGGSSEERSMSKKSLVDLEKYNEKQIYGKG